MTIIELEIGEILRNKRLTLGTMESATGGLIAHFITNIPGSSDYYKGSVIAYANQTKVNVVGIKDETIQRYGAVSSQVAEEMAFRGIKLLDVDICLSDTGIAGPGGASQNKPVGLFYLGLADKISVFSQKHTFTGNREQNKYSAANASLGFLKDYLINLK
jgi:nicotinamide-nucleotide amidase